MRSRPPFISLDPVRRLRPLSPRFRARSAAGHHPRGILLPLVLAAAIAATGQWVGAATDVQAGTRDVVALADASTRDVRDAELRARPVVGAPKVAAAKVAAEPPAPRSTQRASRSTRAAAPAAPRAAGRWVRPCAGAMTSPYGQRWGRMHRGIDLCGNHGIPVVAAGDGTVTLAGYGMSGYGRQVQIRHAGGVVTTYSHLSSITTRVGAKVSAGTPIGRTGSTGNVTGPHLHLEVLVGGSHVDPQAFLRKRGVRV